MSLYASMSVKKRSTRSALRILTTDNDIKQTKQTTANFALNHRCFKPTKSFESTLAVHQQTLERTLWDCFYRTACPCKLADFIYDATHAPGELKHPIDPMIRLDANDISMYLRNIIRNSECVTLLRTILGDNDKLQWLKQYLREVDSGVTQRILSEHLAAHITEEDNGLAINVCTRCYWLFAHLSANQPFVMYTHVIVLLRCIEEQYPMVGIRM